MILRQGFMVGQYELLERLGTGSSGEVWRAVHDDQPYAIKFMNEKLLMGDHAEKHRARLKDEIRAMVLLTRNAHVPTLYSYDLDFERPYLVMEYIDGPSYDRLVASGTILCVPLMKRLEILRKLAYTIQEAHQLNIIHRDIKPSNIKGIDHPYLLDFSIATDMVRHMERNIGTRVYMPPRDDLTERFDHYGFALVAYEMLFGQHAIFTWENLGETMEETRHIAGEAILNKTWRRPVFLKPEDVPGALKGADLKRLDAAFQAAFEAWYHSLIDFVDDLQRSILISDNIPYLDYVPDIAHVGDGLPEQEHYTINEVQQASLPTDLPNEPRRVRLSWRPLALGGGVVLFIAFLLLIRLNT